MAHEFHLVADIRIASADTHFGQDENTHGRFPEEDRPSGSRAKWAGGMPRATC
jgi:enoyl-CoA hydratase/carnithine racemase